MGDAQELALASRRINEVGVREGSSQIILFQGHNGSPEDLNEYFIK